MRLQSVLAPDAVDRGGRQPARLRHRAQRPVRRSRRGFAKGAPDHTRYLLGRGGREGTAARRVPEQPLGPVMHIALLPAPDRRFALSRRSADRHCARAVGGHQHDPRPPDMVLWACAIGDDRFQPLTVTRPKPNLDAFPHAPRLAGLEQHGNHQRRSDHSSIFRRSGIGRIGLPARAACIIHRSPAWTGGMDVFVASWASLLAGPARAGAGGRRSECAASSRPLRGQRVVCDQGAAAARPPGPDDARPAAVLDPAQAGRAPCSIEAHVREHRDATLAELCEWVRTKLGVSVSIGTMWATLRRLGLTLKKSAWTPASVRGTTSPRRVASGTSCKPNWMPGA